MKKLGLLFALACLASTAMADFRPDPRSDFRPEPRPDFRFEQRVRVVNDAVLKATVDAVEAKYRTQCEDLRDPRNVRIEWRCVNGPGCGYSLTVECRGMRGIGGVQLRVTGFDTGTRNDLTQITFDKLR